MTLPQEISDKIKAEAEKKYPFKWPVNSKGEEMVQRVGQNPYGWAKHQNVVKAYIAGATEWGEMAQQAIGTIEQIESVVSWMDDGTFKKKLSEIIAKYKEVGNG